MTEPTVPSDDDDQLVAALVVEAKRQRAGPLAKLLAEPDAPHSSPSQLTDHDRFLLERSQAPVSDDLRAWAVSQLNAQSASHKTPATPSEDGDGAPQEPVAVTSLSDARANANTSRVRWRGWAALGGLAAAAAVLFVMLPGATESSLMAPPSFDLGPGVATTRSANDSASTTWSPGGRFEVTLRPPTALGKAPSAHYYLAATTPAVWQKLSATTESDPKTGTLIATVTIPADQSPGSYELVAVYGWELPETQPDRSSALAGATDKKWHVLSRPLQLVRR